MANLPNTLAETVDGMLSQNYFTRLQTEFDQVSIRLQNLETLLEKYNKGTLGFMPNSPITMLEKQRDIMRQYKEVLRDRISIEMM